MAVKKLTPAQRTQEWLDAARRMSTGPFAPAPAPAQPAAPAAPQVEPYLTPDQQAGSLDYFTGLDLQKGEIEKALRDLGIDTEYQKGQIENTFKHGTAATNNDSAARGIFQSSIRDAALDDLARTRTVNTKFLDDKLAAAQAAADRQLGTIGSAQTQRGIIDKGAAAENAKAANAVVLQNQPEPTPAPAPAPKPQPLTPAQRTQEWMDAFQRTHPASYAPAPAQPARAARPRTIQLAP